MKKIISIILVISMLFISTETIFATDTIANSESYDLEELFVNYQEYSLGEMVKFIGDNPNAYSFVDYLSLNYFKWETNLRVVIHMSGDYSQRIKAFSWFYSKVNTEKYQTENNTEDYRYAKFCYVNTSRPSGPDSYLKYDSVLVGDKGNICINIDIKDDFVDYLKSLNRIERNKMILNFLMNLLDEDIVGISFSFDYEIDHHTNSYEPTLSGDCNGDCAINGVDGYLMKEAILRNNDNLDPLAVDLNADASLNAKDSLELKRKIVIG